MAPFCWIYDDDSWFQINKWERLHIQETARIAYLAKCSENKREHIRLWFVLGKY